MLKVIIWGYPLHTHTHSYVHYGWVKAFKHLGYETHWFDDTSYPNNFDYTNCLFITEGYADNNIPLHSSNIYCVHVAKNPYKYINIGARFIDIRYNVTELKDCNYNYKLAEKSLVQISPVTFYEPNATNKDLNPKFQRSSTLQYEAVYMCWATDLLPHEINLEDRFIMPDNPPVMYFIGSIGGGNERNIRKLIQGCEKQQIKCIMSDPWKNPLSFEDTKKLVQRSIIAPDIRGSGDSTKIGENGTCHKTIGYIPCRLFKNISYGKAGATNCLRIQQLFGDLVLYCEDEEELAIQCIEKSKDTDYIRTQMEWVRDNHTYINRVQDLLTVLNYRR